MPKMNELLTYSAVFLPWIYAGLTLLAGLFFASLAARTVNRMIIKRGSAHQAMLFRRVAYVAVLVLFVVTALQQVGFKLTVLMGAAGILTVALGFASQTSVANVISGVFLILEKSFCVGDIIEVKSVRGKVATIDLMSVKIITMDNRYVRVPNEMLIKSEIINYTRFPTRRAELSVGVAYKEDLQKVYDCLFDLVKENSYALQNPEPKIFFLGFGDSSIDLQLCVWTEKENFRALKNSLQREIKERFDAKGIEIPFPQRVVKIYNA